MTNRNPVSSIQKVGERSIFFQDGGASPDSQPLYRGATSFGGWNTPQGDVTPIYLPSSQRPSTWEIVDTTRTAQGLATSDFTARTNEAIYRQWQTIKRTRCPINIYVKYDDCGSPDDLQSWQYIKLYNNAFLTDFTDSADSPLDGDGEAPVELTGSFSALKEVVIYPVRFEEVADATLLAEVIDGFYGGVPSCGGKCGGRKQECEDLYTLQIANSGSPGLSSQVVFTNDNKQNWVAVDIPTLGGLSGTAMAQAGSYVIVVSENDAAHHFITLADLKNEDALAWDSIATNYVGGLNDVYAKSSAEVFIAGVDGYVYFLASPNGEAEILTDGSVVSDDLRHIKGLSDTVVAAGDNGAVIVSTNNGTTFSSKGVTVNGSALTGNITALGIVSESIWFVAIDGTLYYTLNQGDTYFEKSLGNSVTIINDIAFASESVGYMAVQIGATSRIYRTIDSGYSWQFQDPFVSGSPTAERYSAVIPCWENEVAIGGRVSAGGDGILAIGA